MRRRTILRWLAASPVALAAAQPGCTSGEQASARRPGPPYPPSPAIAGIDWAPASTVVRKAEGSDNWPLTWAADGHLYTAYGDGWGFEPKVPQKLSLGLARIEGDPGSFQGVNLRAPELEQLGPGPKGKKASGMLALNGRLYLLARNAENAQLAHSDDLGQSWTWADWRFEISFGHPAFLNFGPNYEGARDEFVYIYSHDNASAYEAADRMVLARVPADRVLERDAYEFFVGMGADGPSWSADISDRGAVFEYPGGCGRSSISFNAPLERYLWCQIIPADDTRFEGGFGIYDAPEPWGPWTTVFFTERWDVGPGDNCHIPTKWIEDDGRTIYLAFAGDDAFSVRQGRLQLGASAQ